MDEDARARRFLFFVERSIEYCIFILNEAIVRQYCDDWLARGSFFGFQRLIYVHFIMQRPSYFSEVHKIWAYFYTRRFSPFRDPQILIL